MFVALLNQMAFLFGLILIGYALMKLRLVPENSEAVLSKLESYLFIPALVMGTFMTHFTKETLKAAPALLLGSLGMELLVIPLAVLAARLCAKDAYIRKMYLYGLAISNFGFMGNAVMEGVFEEIFPQYVIFTLVLWAAVYLWGVPVLLIPQTGEKRSVRSLLKNFANPMFAAVLVGMLFGLLELPIPKFAASLISSAGACMSPVAMLITGMTVAKTKLKSILTIKSVYAVSAFRLLVFPLLFIGVYVIFGRYFDSTFAVCALASLAMPLGLNTIVIPGAYGLDTKVASGMALISHALSVITVPLMFTLLEKI